MNKTSEGHASSVRILKDVAELKRLAEAATPGPWSYYVEDNILSSESQPTSVIAVTYRSVHCTVEQRIANGTFAAAANPAAILELLAQRDELLKALEGLLIAETAVFPAFNEGMAAQDQWSMNRANAHDAARAAIEKITGVAL